jgi:hypothetical protein
MQGGLESSSIVKVGQKRVELLRCNKTELLVNHHPSEWIENRTFDEIAVGDSAELSRTLRPDDIHLFAVLSGDLNPTHIDPEYACSGQFREIVGHSMWGGLDSYSGAEPETAGNRNCPTRGESDQ